MRFSGKLYVRIRSERSRERTWEWRISAASWASSSCFIASSRDLRTRNAACRFCIWDFSSCILTTIPVGICVIRTAEYVVFTDCPPGPELMNMSIFRSLGSTVISSSSSSASGNTITPAAEVWMRPWDSVTGIRCTRCTPPSYLSDAHTPSAGATAPLVRNAIWRSFTPPSSVIFWLMTSVDHPRFSAYRVYIRSRSPAKSAASSPPAPALISMIVSRASSGSRGISAVRSFSSSCGSCASSRAASAAKPSSSAANSCAASRSPATRLYSSYMETICASSAWRRPSLRILSGSDAVSGVLICCSISWYSSSASCAAGKSSTCAIRIFLI